MGEWASRAFSLFGSSQIVCPLTRTSTDALLRIGQECPDFDDDYLVLAASVKRHTSTPSIRYGEAAKVSFCHFGLAWLGLA